MFKNTKLFFLLLFLSFSLLLPTPLIIFSLKTTLVSSFLFRSFYHNLQFICICFFPWIHQCLGWHSNTNTIISWEIVHSVHMVIQLYVCPGNSIRDAKQVIVLHRRLQIKSTEGELLWNHFIFMLDLRFSKNNLAKKTENSETGKEVE